MDTVNTVVQYALCSRLFNHTPLENTVSNLNQIQQFDFEQTHLNEPNNDKKRENEKHKEVRCLCDLE